MSSITAYTPLSRYSYTRKDYVKNAPVTTCSTGGAVLMRRLKKETEEDEKKKVVVIMGATGSGKSRLSVDLATQYFPDSVEVVNSDKIQFYRGLDITTNKMAMADRRGIPHHLLGELDPGSDMSASEYRAMASERISDIIARDKIPFIVGGSNSYIYALLAKQFNPEVDVFKKEDRSPSPASGRWELRYNCCFLWVDVLPGVLNRYLDKRVDDMVRAGMMEELEEWFQSTGTPASTGGLMKAIGVPEFARYESGGSLEACVGEIKENTRVLAERQRWKIRRFGQEVAAEGGLKMHRVDATAAFAAAMMMGPAGSKSESTEIWEKEVLQPSRDILKDFLSDVIISSEKQKQYALREHII